MLGCLPGLAINNLGAGGWDPFLSGAGEPFGDPRIRVLYVLRRVPKVWARVCLVPEDLSDARVGPPRRIPRCVDALVIEACGDGLEAQAPEIHLINLSHEGGVLFYNDDAATIPVRLMSVAGFSPPLGLRCVPERRPISCEAISYPSAQSPMCVFADLRSHLLRCTEQR